MANWKDRLKGLFCSNGVKEERPPLSETDKMDPQPASVLPTSSKVAESSGKAEALPEANEISGAGFDQFRFPAAWVDAGRHLQPSDSTPGRMLSVRLGIDFGTAYSKAAVQIADSVYIIDFGGISGSAESPWLLPGEISLDPSGLAWIGRHPDGQRVLDDLKLPFIATSKASLESKVSATVFLAWIMRYLRAWIYRHHSNLVSNRRLGWEVNLGMPSASWADENLVGRYKETACAAWVLSQENGTPTLSRAREILLEDALPFDEIGLVDLQLIPEFVAQLAGYVMSPQRPEKGNELHLLVDVGAGTLDVACFGAYHPPDQDHYNFPTWASAVETLGTHFLMESRVLGIEVAAEEWSDMSRMPDHEEFAAKYGVSADLVRKIDEDFSRKVASTIGQVLVQTKIKRNPTAREWESGLRVFLAGGGSSCPAYVSAVKLALKKIRSPMNEMAFHLHKVENDQALDQELVHRLSVAYGLTFDADSIGEAIPPQDIKDFKSVNEQFQRPDRDELYPK